MARSVVFLLVLATSLLGSGSTNAATCSATGFVRDRFDLTAAQIGGDVSGDIDATGCDIGVYYPAGSSGTVNAATVHGARYFGIVADGAAVDVTESAIFSIGESPFNGGQHGVAIYFTNGASGTISGNQVHDYQKGGIVVNGARTAAAVTANDVRGLGPVAFIAQNGIQVSRGAVADVRGNSIADNYYTGHVGVGPNPGGQNPPGWEYTSTGLLLYQAGDGTKTAENHFSGNQHNKAVVP